jgi:hypothetical protein
MSLDGELSLSEARERNRIVDQDTRFLAAVRAFHPGIPGRSLPMTAKAKVPEDAPHILEEETLLDEDEVTPILPHPLSWKRIVREVATKHQLTVPEMLAHRRHRALVKARQECCYRLYKETTMSLPEIGRRLGYFDHTTILHSVRRHTALLGAKGQA